MGHRCCGKQKVKRGLWSPEEDEKLVRHITTHGHGSWSAVPKLAGLQRCGKSCRLRWINYLRPDLRRGSFTAEEEQIIIDVHRILGNRWAQIAKHLPGRTDNEVKNFWNSCIKKKLISQGLDPKTHNLIPAHKRASVSGNKPANTTAPSKPKRSEKESKKEGPPPFSIITVNPQSNHRSDAVMKSYNAPARMVAEPPLLPPPLPPPPPANHHHQSTDIIDDQYESPNPLLWGTLSSDVQANPHEPMSNGVLSHVPCIDLYSTHIPSFSCSSSSSSSLIITPSMLCHIDENQYYSNWDANAAIYESFDATAVQAQDDEGAILRQQEINKMMALEEANKESATGQDPTDISFDCPSFDLEFSTLLHSNLSPMDDLGWNL